MLLTSGQRRRHFLPPIGLPWDSPPPPQKSASVSRRTLTISRIDSLPDLLTNGAPPLRPRRSCAKIAACL